MIKIEAISANNENCLELVQGLIKELGSNAEQADLLNIDKIKSDLKDFDDNLHQFVAKADDTIVGLITLQESFSFYADGKYGKINEMYIKPDYRSKGIGKKLLASVIKVGKDKNWKRIDVTAPPGEKWKLTTDFYKNNGFIFTGPKLKYLL
jgi:GNAT superfamily N-acetyltransferase